MSLPLSQAHSQFDPLTNRCVVCGAARSEVEDGLVPDCEPIEGENRLALIYVRSAIRWMHARILYLENSIARMKRSIDLDTQELLQRQQEFRALMDSSDFLQRKG